MVKQRKGYVFFGLDAWSLLKFEICAASHAILRNTWSAAKPPGGCTGDLPPEHRVTKRGCLVKRCWCYAVVWARGSAEKCLGWAGTWELGGSGAAVWGSHWWSTPCAYAAFPQSSPGASSSTFSGSRGRRAVDFQRDVLDRRWWRCWRLVPASRGAPGCPLPGMGSRRISAQVPRACLAHIFDPGAVLPSFWWPEQGALARAVHICRQDWPNRRIRFRVRWSLSAHSGLALIALCGHGTLFFLPREVRRQKAIAGFQMQAKGAQAKTKSKGTRYKTNPQPNKEARSEG